MTNLEPVAGRVARAGAWASDHRYRVVVAVLASMTVYFNQKHRWGAGFDVWEHAAAIRELARHPWHPHHPQLAIDAPHQFFSPYSLAWGLVSRVTGIGPFGILAIASLVNLLLLLFAIKVFVDRLSARRHVAFWTVLFTLLLWGANTWFFSGFSHANVLWIDLPYPATFVCALILLTLTSFLVYLDDNNWPWLVGIALSFACVFLTHPADAPFLAVGLGVLALARGRPGTRVANLVLVVVVVAVGYAMATAWPYYDLRSLLFGAENARFRAATRSGDHDMYVAVYSRAFLALLGVPFVVLRLVRSRGRDAVGLLFLGALAIYCYGWQSERWSYGRVVVYAVLFLHVALADGRVSAAEAADRAGEIARPLLTWLRVTTVALLLFAGTYMRNGLAQATPMATALPARLVRDDGNLVHTSRLAFVARWAGHGEVVMADPLHGWPLPAYGAKTVTTIHPLAFVPSADARVADVARFFAATTSVDLRRQLIRRYHVRFVLLAAGTPSGVPNTASAIAAMGTVVFRDGTYALVALPPGD